MSPHNLGIVFGLTIVVEANFTQLQTTNEFVTTLIENFDDLFENNNNNIKDSSDLPFIPRSETAPISIALRTVADMWKNNEENKTGNELDEGANATKSDEYVNSTLKSKANTTSSPRLTISLNRDDLDKQDPAITSARVRTKKNTDNSKGRKRITVKPKNADLKSTNLIDPEKLRKYKEAVNSLTHKRVSTKAKIDTTKSFLALLSSDVDFKLWLEETGAHELVTLLYKFCYALVKSETVSESDEKSSQHVLEKDKPKEVATENGSVPEVKINVDRTETSQSQNASTQASTEGSSRESPRIATVVNQSPHLVEVGGSHSDNPSQEKAQTNSTLEPVYDKKVENV
eukprot:TRINITY_DN2137_c0_g1_i1.p1 TRINITY_DN2137_c0_g1~~TRINITY_DN2137_c0_g1_i1.p1  ORF type:complete len:397 (-),score=71.76 TRINITY_DN2137_c0_g1_i1:114-1145(-)